MCCVFRNADAAQFLAMKTHSASLGLSGVKRIIATGGASQNAAILQVLSDVFQVRVFVIPSSDQSASVGAALRAMHGVRCAQAGGFVPFIQRSNGSSASGSSSPANLVLAAVPAPNNEAIVARLTARFKRLEARTVDTLKTEARVQQ